MVNLSAYQFADLPVFLYLLTQVSPPESVTCIIQLLIEHFYLIIFVHVYINIYINEATIKKYIEEQEKHDIALDKLSVKEYEDPFKGSK